MSEKVFYVCGNCGDENVFIKQYKNWNVERQVFELDSLSGSEASCNECGMDTVEIVPVPVYLRGLMGVQSDICAAYDRLCVYAATMNEDQEYTEDVRKVETIFAQAVEEINELVLNIRHS